MGKMRYYKVFQGGGAEVGTVMATCISNACQKHIDTLSCPTEWDYKLYSREYAAIRNLLNCNIVSDFVIYEL